MKVKLMPSDRQVLLNMLPGQGSIVKMRTVKDIISKLILTDEEIKKYDYKETPHKIGDRVAVHIMMNLKSKDPEAEVEMDFTSAEMSLLKDEIKSKDTAGQITLDMLKIVELFS